MLPGEAAIEPLMIKGRAVDRGMLKSRAASRCRLEDCQSYCCSGGVYIHTRQVEDLLAHQALIIPHLPPERQDPALWFDNKIEPDEDYPEAGDCMGTSVVPDPTHPAGATCIFLTSNRRCALQTASIAAGEDPWRFKPFYCALHPLEIIDGELKLAEDNELYQEGGHCQRPDYSRLIPLYQLFDVETKLVLGDEGYAELDRIARGKAT
jgi:hypothetical protein